MADAAANAYTAIRDDIVAGRLNRGEWLREGKLAQELGVSRTPIREALRRLEAEGLVEFAPNRGARVTAWSALGLEDLYQIRARLESLAARLAATRREPADIAELESTATRMAELAADPNADREELTELNNHFHRAVVLAARSRHLATQLRGIIDIPLISRTFHKYAPERIRISAAQHLELVAAIRARDGDWADALMQAHILAARSVMVPTTNT
ncbi:GntR family transcriptional regulator [Nocardia sp. BMG111209]|uniref:GntR family transcriptional regulator n=1 Tax=Nocardia sp. BMG111209 TaxID=1160137 RepID=UPI000363ADAC|nr:GntR family transcriptional regulator [Nocardia sp. BMG111209]